jgi:hypothetical protein
MLKFLLLAVMVLGIPAVAAAQSDRHEIMIAAMLRMRASLGDSVVLEKAAIFGRDDEKHTFSDKLLALGFRIIDWEDIRRCSRRGDAYFTGPEIVLSVHAEPEVSINRARIVMFWTVGMKSLQGAIAELGLGKASGRWTVTQEGKHQYLDYDVGECSDRDEIAVKTLKHLRKELGPNMVVDAGMRTWLPEHHGADYTFDGIIARAGIRTVEEALMRRCKSEGVAYYTGPEIFLRFDDPRISGDKATIKVLWKRPTGSTVPPFIESVQTVFNLELTDDQWFVTGEGEREVVNATARYCVKPD